MNKDLALDIAQRVVRCFIFTFCGVLLTFQELTLHTLQAAGTAAVFALCTAVVGGQFGDKTTGSLPIPGHTPDSGSILP